MYFLLIVDDHSRLMWVAVLKYKVESFNAFERLKGLAEAQKSLKVSTFRTYRGDFNSIEFYNF